MQHCVPTSHSFFQSLNFLKEYSMKAKIAKLGERANKVEVKLHREVMDLENHMNECDCDDSVIYNFFNTVGHYEIHVFCLNCGGYKKPIEDM